MRTVLRVLGGLVLAIAAVAAGTLVVARFHDGPLALVAGGAFKSGTSYAGPEPDWSFLKDVPTIEFQSLAPVRSRTTWILVHDGRAFIPCGYMNSAWGRLWKKWPLEIERDGRVILRVDGTLYEQSLVRVQEGPELEPVLAELSRKYVGQPIPPEAVASGALWLFEVSPRR